MSLEQQIARLADAVEHNNTLLAALRDNGGLAAADQTTAPAETGKLAKAEDTAKTESGDDNADNEIIWYHAPDEKKVWSEEGPAKRRKGVIKVDESTAERLIKQYEEEAAAEEAEEPEDTGANFDDGLGDFDLGGDEEDAPKFDESQEMSNDDFAKHWNAWTKEAIAHAEKGGADKQAAQREVKQFIVPVVQAFAGKGNEPKVANITPDLRAKFLNKAHDFFNNG